MATPIERVILWDRANDYAISIPQATFVDDVGDPLTFGDISAVVARVWAVGTVEPPVTFGSRGDVALAFDGAKNAWRGRLQYDNDLNAVPEVRVTVTATIATRPARVIDATARFTQADGR